MIITFSFSFYDIFLVFNLIQTSCFFNLEKVADLDKQSSRRVSSAVGAYWNPCILTTCHYLDLGSAVEENFSSGTIKIRSTIQSWVVTRHQYGISELVSQTSFRGKTRGDAAKCRLFSQDQRHSRGTFIYVFSKLSDKPAWRNGCDISLPH